jgi:hypothetical protein
MSWHFSAPVIEAFADLGLTIPAGLTSFILKVLSMKVVPEGITEFPKMGLGLSTVKKENEYTVDLVE